MEFVVEGFDHAAQAIRPFYLAKVFSTLGVGEFEDPVNGQEHLELALGQDAVLLFQPLEFGLNSRRRSDATVKHVGHTAFSSLMDKITSRLLGTLPLHKLRLEHEPNGLPSIVRPAGSHHLMSTARMHENPNFGVVDAERRVHGVRNLFVAGSSAFSVGGYANPTLTTVAMALRPADLVKRDMIANTLASRLFNPHIHPAPADQVRIYARQSSGFESSWKAT